MTIDNDLALLVDAAASSQPANGQTAENHGIGSPVRVEGQFPHPRQPARTA